MNAGLAPIMNYSIVGNLMPDSNCRFPVVNQPRTLQGISRLPFRAMRASTLRKRLSMEVLGSCWFEFIPSCSFASQRSRNVTASASKTITKQANGSGDDDRKRKAEALRNSIEALNDRFGMNTVISLSSTESLDIDYIPTGALTLDMALGGGLPKGRIIEIFGPESSGKSTLALQAIAAVQAAGGMAVLVDAEHALDRNYAKRMGVNVDDMFISQPETGEMALEVVDGMLRSNALDIVVVDSVAALVPRAELEGEIGDKQMGLQARMMSQAMRKLSGNAAKANCTVIFINQLRQKIGVFYGNPEVTTGGNALKYYSSVRIDVRRIKTLEGSKDEPLGIRVRAKTVKNKTAAPFKIAEFDILFTSGINKLGCIVEAAEKVGVLVRKGAWYSYEGNNIGQGRDKTVAKLKQDAALRSEIEEKTRAVLKNTDINEIYETQAENGSLEEGEEEDDDSVLDLSSLEEPLEDPDNEVETIS